MKLIICGSRTIVPSNDDTVRTFELGFPGSGKTITYVSKSLMFSFIDGVIGTYFRRVVTEVVSGMADGGDQFGELWAKERGIPVKPFAIKPEEWRLFGKGAGHRRNRQMGDYVAQTMDTLGAGVLAIWDGKSRGTQGMLDYAKELGIKRVVIELSNGKARCRELK